MRIVVTVAAMFVLLTLVIFVHECGHLLAGLLNGMRCDLLTIGPVRLERKEQSLKLSWNRNLWLAGGAVIMLPADDGDLGRRATWMVAGGPLASLALALTGCGAHWILGGTPGGRLCLFIALCSASIFAVTAIPSHLTHPSDGARLLMLWRGGSAAEEWCTFLVKMGAHESRKKNTG